MSDLAQLFHRQEEVRRWNAECENAQARLQLAKDRAAAAELLSQHDPVHGLGVDREALRILLDYVFRHDKAHLAAQISAFRESREKQA